MDDKQIIALFFERSEQAIKQLEMKYGPICKQIATNILKNEEDARECVNDAFLAAWNTIPPQNPNPLLTYICKIVRNLSNKKYHSNTAKKRNSYYDIALQELEACIFTSSSPEDLFAEKELAKIINTFLEELDKESRVMFVRRYFYSDSIPDIASRFGISKHNATVRLSRIRSKLKLFLEKEGIWI